MGYWILLPQRCQPLLVESALQGATALPSACRDEATHCIHPVPCPLLFDLSWSQHVQEFRDSWGITVRTYALSLFKLSRVG